MKNHLMYWSKVGTEKFLSFIPGEAGFKVHERVINLIRPRESINLRNRIEMSLDNVRRIEKNSEAEFEEAVMLELGTGWHCCDIIVYHLLGAGEFVTYDHFDHRNIGMMHGIVNDIMKDEAVVDFFEQRAPGVEKKLKKLASAQSMEDFFEVMNAHFYDDYKKIEKKYSRHFNFVYTNSVLQRIPSKELKHMIKGFNHLCTGRTFQYHRVDCKDFHCIKRIVSGGVHQLSYLRYPDWFYHNVLSCRFNTQNRWRESDFITEFEANGWNLVYKDSRANEEDLNYVRSMPLAKPFRSKDPEDLAIAASILLFEKTFD